MLKLKKVDSDDDGFIDIHDKFSIGRGSENDIIIDSENISRRHCLITIDKGGNVFVKDLGSLNGTIVNSKRIDRALVEKDDILQVGDEGYIFVSIDDIALEKEVEKPVLNLKSILLNEYSREKINSVTIKSMQGNRKEFYCPSDSIYTIGRLQFCDIIIDDDSVSRTHATIDVREGRVLISDSNSTNGTFVNSEEEVHKVLKNGDVIGIGEAQFNVYFDVISEKYFNSLKRSTNTVTIDLLEDYDNVIGIYESKYDNSVLLEVERQALIFCQEFEQLFRIQRSIKIKQDSIVKFIGLLSGSMHIIDPVTYKIITSENSNIDIVSPDYIQLIVGMVMERREGRILYFEEMDPDGSTGIQMNGVYVVINNDTQLLILGIPYNNLLYFIYAASWMSQFYVDVNEKN